MANVESAHAIIFVENLSETRTSGLTVGSTSGAIHGSSFTTDSNSYTLNSVTARLGELTEADIFISVYTDNAGQPGTAIEQLSTVADISNSFNDYLFTPSNTVNLAADTT